MDTELARKETKVKALNQEIDKLESNRDGILDWVAKQTAKCTELAEKMKEFNEEYLKKKNFLEAKSKELVQKEQGIKKQEVELQKLKQSSQFDRGLADASQKNVEMAKQALSVKEAEVKQREASIISREAKVDEAISYIQSVFKSIERLKV